MKDYKYFAFISYNQQDVAWGKRLQRKLENYKMAATLCSEKGWKRTPIRPVFFAPTDIQPNELTEELKARLEASRNLIVICSPHSAQSEWVGREIAYFHSLGREKNIHFFIIDGVPNSNDPQTECFNPVIKELGMSERLGANINERNYSWNYMNRQRAYVQLITKLLGIEFDTIWQRHKRHLIEKWTTIILLGIAILCSIAWAWMAHRPITVSVALEEVMPPNNNLPKLSDAEVTLVLENDIRQVRTHSMDEVVCFTNVPKNWLGSNVELHFVDFPDTPESANYYPTEIKLKLEEKMTIPVCRDTIKHGRLKARVIDRNHHPLPNYKISIAGLDLTTDDKGNIDTYIPYENQRRSYVVMNDTLTDVGMASRLAIIVD